MKALGIIAGNGHLPLIAARQAKAEGLKVYVAAVKGEADDLILDIADEVCWVKLGELKKLVRFFNKHSVSQACMEGKITKTNIFKGHVRPDLDMLFLFSKLPDKKDDTILASICDYIDSKGVTIIDSTRFLSDCLPGEGVLTRKRPDKKKLADIEFGLNLAKSIAGLDIGQSVIVKDTAVLAVEAIEGTDEAILRGGELGGKGATVVKVEKPDQDMRFDVPTVGPNTINSMIKAKAAVLAFEAGKTIFVEQEKVVSEADQNGIVIVGINHHN